LEKILLIFPKTGLDIYSQLPLGLLSIASTIVDDYEVKIIDQRTENNWAEKISNESQDSICVGITSMTGEKILIILKRYQTKSTNNDNYINQKNYHFFIRNSFPIHLLTHK